MVSREREREKDVERGRLRTPLGQNGARLYSAATAKCILLLNLPFSSLTVSFSFYLSCVHLFPSFSFCNTLSSFFLSSSFSLSLSPSIGPGIPSCGCKIDGASRDNCCSGTRFQTRVHLEYSWRKALPIVNGGREGRIEGGKEGA